MSELHVEKFMEKAKDWKPKSTGTGPKTAYGMMNIMKAKGDFPWKLSDEAQKALEIGRFITKTKHGLNAMSPIMCGKDHCPYRKVCLPYDMGIAPLGDRCPVEIAMILDLTERYTTELNADPTSIVTMGLIKDLVDCHIMIARADALIASGGEIIQDVAIGIGEDGQVVERPEISKAIDVRDRYMNMKTKILSQLMATPKDKASLGMANMKDPSQYAAELMKKARAMKIVEGEVISDG